MVNTKCSRCLSRRRGSLLDADKTRRNTTAESSKRRHRLTAPEEHLERRPRLGDRLAVSATELPKHRIDLLNQRGISSGSKSRFPRASTAAQIGSKDIAPEPAALPLDVDGKG